MSEVNLRALNDLLLAQLAAESYLDQVPIGNPFDELRTVLQLGNNNPSFFPDPTVPDLPGRTRMTDAQIASFNRIYEVVDHLPNTWAGFSGTLLRNTQTDEYVLSFRSTEWANESQGGDWLRDGIGVGINAGADNEIGVYGFAVAQIADAEAYFRNLRTRDLLPSSANFWMTGYSLGGHIATVLAEAHADDAQFLGAVTFNSPGRGQIAIGKTVKELVGGAYARLSADNALLQSGSNGSIYGQSFYAGDDFFSGARTEILASFDTRGLFGPNRTPSEPTLLASGKIIQVFGLADTDDSMLVTNSGIHSSNYLQVFIEDQPDIQGLGLTWLDHIFGLKSDFGTTHSITLIADSVAAGELLQAIDASADQARINAIFSTGSNERGINVLLTSGVAESASLERIIEAMAKLYGVDLNSVGPQGEIPAGITGGAFGNLVNRNAYWDAIGLVRARVDIDLGGTLLPIAVSGSVLAAAAKEDTDSGLAYRYSLVEGNGFVLFKDRGFYDDSAKGLNADQRLYLAASGGPLTDFYLEDRATYLERKIYYNVQNARYDLTRSSSNPGDPGDADATRFDGENIVWTDLASGVTIQRRASSSLTQYRVFGSDSANVVTGGGGLDRLYGGADTDYLIGKAESDYLEGGTGLDIYEYHSARKSGLITTPDGHDTILDVDGKGVLRYLNNDENEKPQSTVIAGVAIAQADGTWKTPDGQFVLKNQGNAVKVTFGSAIDGSIVLRDFRSGDFSIRLWEPRPEPKIGNVIVSDNSSIADTASNDQIITGAADNHIGATNGGDDVINAGAGRDRVEAGPGHDVVEGGIGGETGGDIIDGGDGDDVLYGDTFIDWAEAIRAGRIGIGNGLRGDWLSGGSGNDVLIGSNGNNVLVGGRGADILIGGAGDDNIGGGAQWVATSFDWGFERLASNNRSFFPIDGEDHPTDDEGDVAYGGAGNDYIWGGYGNDVLFGEDGDDYLGGQWGDDILIGGDGNDILEGDDEHFTASEFGDDYLDGGAGNDELYGYGGDDILIGGPGTDILVGGPGKDIYIFNRGNGADTIYDDSDGPEKSLLFFGDGFDPTSVTLIPGSLILDFGDGDSVRFANFDFYDPNAVHPFERLSFADGTILSFEEVIAKGFDFAGTDGDDDGHDAAHPVLIGTAFRDRIRGHAGNDVLAGLQGDDALDGGAGDDELQGGDGNDLLDGGEGSDRLFGEAGDDILIGGAGWDALVGSDGDDRLFGGDEPDVLFGGAGNDYLDGGASGDRLFGGLGNDTYVFDEADSVLDVDGATTIAFTGAEHPEDLELRQLAVNGQPVFTIRKSPAAGGDPFAFGLGITLSDPSQLAAMVFADGLVLTGDEMLRATLVDGKHIVGTDGDDELKGYAGNDALVGGVGNDTLYGLRGNDRLEGEAGNDKLDGGSDDDILIGGVGDDKLIGGIGDDLLTGGEGSDVYVYARGDGNDVISEQGDEASIDVLRFTDVAATEATIERQSSGDLVVSVAAGGQVTVSGFYLFDSQRIERIEFADGTVVDAGELNALTVAPITGTEGDDVLTGTPYADTLLGLGGADVLDGGGGDDVLVGGAGVDSYRLGLLPGQATLIEDNSETSIIRLPDGFTFRDLQVERSADDLVLAVRDSQGSVLVPGYYAGETNWAVTNAMGETQSLGELVAFLEEIAEPQTPQQFEDKYVADARRKYGIYLASWGATGGVIINEQPLSDAPIIFRDPPFSETGSGCVFFLNIARITAGPSDNVLDFRQSNLVIADAGAGDDLINNQGWGFSDSSIGTIGSFLYGNEGYDRILGSWGADVLLGGPGDNYLAGSDGDDTYVVFATDDGTQIIDEVVEDVNLPGGHFAFAGGRNSTDTLVFSGVDLQDVVFGTGRFDAAVVGGTGAFATLDMSWGTAGLVRLILPDPNHSAVRAFPGHSYGVEFVRFGGQVLTPVVGTEGLDSLFGTAADDVLIGLAGNDFLSGGAGANVYIGGAGNDFLSGRDGPDTYFFSLGDGHDTISDFDFSGTGAVDTLRFGPGILPADVIVTRDFNLNLHVNGTADQVKIQGWAGSDMFKIERIAFADGTVWGLDDTDALAIPVAPTEGNDGISGTRGNDVIDGLGGDDVIIGDGGGDVLYGGEGHDYLEGDAGNDILVGGDGNDDLEEWEGNNLIDAGAGDDYVYNEVRAFIIGGPGDDWIDIYGDGAIVAFNAGDGADTVYAGGSLTLSLGGGIELAALRLRKEGSDLVLSLGGADSIRLTGLGQIWPELRLQLIAETSVSLYDFNAAVSQLPSLANFPIGDALQANVLASSVDQAIGGDIAYLYAHGRLDILSSVDALRAVLAGPGFGVDLQQITNPDGPALGNPGGNALLVGGRSSETLAGNAGNDWIEGSEGNDTLIGGPGDDLLFGGPGADTYVFNLGDGVDTVYDPSAPGESNTVLFGDGIAPEDLTLDLGSLLLRVGAGDDAIRFLSFDPANPFGARDVDRFVFADDTALSYESLLARGFDINGTSADDTLRGTTLTDRMSGFAGNDTLDAGAGDDVLDGGTGNDLLRGGAGNDTYRFGQDYGIDAIEDSDGDNDTLEPGSGILPADITVTRSADNLTLAINDTADRVVLRWQPDLGYRIERVLFADGTLWNADELVTLAGGAVNVPPVLAVPIPDLDATEDAEFAFVVPEAAFLDTGDTLTYIATRFDGSALPAWLAFDGAARLFSGTPENDDVGEISIAVTVTDAGGLTASGSFTLTVANTNDAPQIVGSIEDVITLEDDAFTLIVPKQWVRDVDAGDVLFYAVSGANGASLPEWLSLDPEALTFTGTPANEDVGAVRLSVTATDPAGESVSTTFNVTVQNVNDEPIRLIPLPDRHAHQNAAVGFVVPDWTFFDVDAGDTLSLAATLADGGALPKWLNFDAATGAFSGTPSEFDAGDHTLRVTATDSAGASVHDDFNLHISDASTVNAVHTGTKRADLITTGFENDLIDAGPGDDMVRADAGRDLVFGGKGDDLLYGELGNDVLHGGHGRDRLFGGAGDDQLFGGKGEDTLDGGSGNDVLAGGAGHDRISTGTGSNIVAGGKGHDVITGGPGIDVFLLNPGEGKDTLELSGAALAGNADVLSLGGGVTSRDVRLKRDGNDLVLKATRARGDEDDDSASVVFQHWYADAGNHQTVTTLQLFENGTPVQFDFKALAARFDAANSGTTRTGQWDAAQALAEVQLAAVEKPAGGELAAYYAANGSLPGEALLSDEELDGFWPGIDDEAGNPKRRDDDDDRKKTKDAKKHGKDSHSEDREEARLRRLIENWFAPHGDFLSELDEIARGEGGVRASSRGEEIAAAWTRSQRWVERLLAARDGVADDGALGAGLGGLSFTPAGGGLAELPRAAVGLHKVPGHDLKPFRGIKEGFSVLD